MFLHLLRPNQTGVLTLKKVTNLLKPDFSEEGSNRRWFEGEVYSNFLKYLRQTAGKLDEFQVSLELQLVMGGS